jgi:paraquat-inducible protein A
MMSPVPGRKEVGYRSSKMPLVVVCPACDLVLRGDDEIGQTASSGRVRCSRCRSVLHRPRRAPVDNAVALALSALVLFFLGNVYPLVEFRINGVTRETNLVGAALGLFHAGHSALGLLVLLTTVAAPLAQILGLLYLLIPLLKKRRARRQSTVFRLLVQIRPWTFIEVFMLGAVVALVRLSAFAKVVPGVALVCCGLLMICMAALTNLTSAAQFWHWVARSRR